MIVGCHPGRAVIVFGIVPCIAAWGCDLFQATYQAMAAMAPSSSTSPGPPPFDALVRQMEDQGIMMTGFFAMSVQARALCL